jgi:hypothetical protein
VRGCTPIVSRVGPPARATDVRDGGPRRWHRHPHPSRFPTGTDA